jgi:hypothetical protein
VQRRSGPSTLHNPALCWNSGAAGCVMDQYPRGLIDPKGAVPGLARGRGHTAPTYAVGFPGSMSHGPGGSALGPVAGSLLDRSLAGRLVPTLYWTSARLPYFAPPR